MAKGLVTPATRDGQAYRGISGGMLHRAGAPGLAAASLWVCIGIATLSRPAAAENSPFEVTSDTPEYCVRLLDRIARLVTASSAPLPREVFDLSSEGQRMCDHGQTRGGILRLRRALVIMKQVGE
jgi:hypothetical protein